MEIALFCLLLHPAFASCSSGSKGIPVIDGERALEHVRAITSFGPHPAGSRNQRRVGLYLIEQLKSCGLEVQTQAFVANTPHGPREMVNIWGVLPGSSETTLLLGSHYDSKHFEEFEFVGANDSGSSSAVLLELARSLASEERPEMTLWFVFFDGEEAFEYWTDSDSLYGSREFVRMLRQKGQLDQIGALVLLDLIGGKTVQIRKDINSTNWLNSLFWEQAKQMGHSDIFLPYGTTAAQDDHIPFLEAGIPAIDLIDLNYPYWHTADDTVDKLSAEKMEIIGNVILATLPVLQHRLKQMK